MVGMSVHLNRKEHMMSTSAPRGGVTFNSWVLAGSPREFTSKSTGTAMTLVELRDPERLGNSLVLFADGPLGKLAAVRPSTPVTLRVDEVRGGRHRGELSGSVARVVLEAALGVSS
jgi:hypothetical protein